MKMNFFLKDVCLCFKTGLTSIQKQSVVPIVKTSSLFYRFFFLPKMLTFEFLVRIILQKEERERDER